MKAHMSLCKHCKQCKGRHGDINCGPSSHSDFTKNFFLWKRKSDFFDNCDKCSTKTIFLILECGQSVFRVSSECGQSVFRVCSECVQGVFRVCSECVQYVQSVFRVCFISSPNKSSESVWAFFVLRSIGTLCSWHNMTCYVMLWGSPGVVEE